MSSDKITFYTNGACPYAQRAAIALKEVGAEYEPVEIDLQNKPSWYKDINPELKVPALNTEGQNVAESLVIIEYINDRFPDKNLLPKEAIRRANVRFAIEFFGSKITPAFYKFVLNSKESGAFEQYKETINAGLERFNELLLQQAAKGPYFLGNEYSLADVAIAPFLQRLYATGRFVESEDFEFELVKANPRLAEFIKGTLARPSVQETYCGDAPLIEMMQKKFGLTKA